MLDDDVLGLAAQLSYYFFLALFPALLFLLALASFFSLSNVTDDIGRSLGPLVSVQVLELIQEHGGSPTMRMANWSRSASWGHFGAVQLRSSRSLGR
jgi:hypothetical protein